MAIVPFAGTAPVAGIPLSVWLAGTQMPATIYADALLTPLANPFDVDGVNGRYLFYAEETVPYDLSFATEAGEPLPIPPSASDAPSDQAYVLTQAAAALPYGRVLTAGANISLDLSTPREVAVSSTGGGDGDVTGPASAVDSRIAAFDGTTGKLLKDGGSTIAGVLATAAAAAAALVAGINTALTVDPASPSDDQVWFFQTGSSPTILSIRFRKGGTTVDFPIGSKP